MKGAGLCLFGRAFWFGLSFQCELAGAPLIILLPVAVWLKQTKISRYMVVPTLQGLVLGLLPQIIYDLTHGFRQLGLFAVWVGYRIAAFGGYKDNLTVSAQSLFNVSATIKLYLHRILTGNEVLYFILGLTLLSGLYFWLTLPKKSASPVSLVWWWILLLLGSYVIHGVPSEAYFPALFVPLSLALGWTFSQVQSANGRLLAPLLVGIIMAANTHFIVATPSTAWLPRLSTQQEVVDLIKTHVGSPIRLRSIGPGSQFPAFLDNFRYLLWYNDIKVSDDGEPVWLVFGPEKSSPPLINMKSFVFDDLTVSLPL